MKNLTKYLVFFALCAGQSSFTMHQRPRTPEQLENLEKESKELIGKDLEDGSRPITPPRQRAVAVPHAPRIRRARRIRKVSDRAQQHESFRKRSREIAREIKKETPKGLKKEEFRLFE